MSKTLKIEFFHPGIFKFQLFFILTFLLNGCIEPVTPEFDFEEGLVFIEGFASSNTGSSFVSINESVSEFGVNRFDFISGAEVSLVNIATGSIINFTESEESYISPLDFSVSPGEKWKLNVVLSDGRIYESEPEVVLSAVPVSDIKINYNREVEYRESLDQFIPGHSISVSFNDPLDTENYYYWSYRVLENLNYCVRCQEGIYRNGGCIPYDLAGNELRYFDYICETECWRIRYPEETNIFEDRFSNGKSVENLEVGIIPLYTNENMVVEVQQYSLTPDAYKYYKILKDITNNSGGFNAPPSAALVGNLFNPGDSNEFVLGRFTAAASVKSNVFVERINISEATLGSRQPPNISLEPTIGSPYPPPPTNLAPCVESRYRTANEPEGWQ